MDTNNDITVIIADDHELLLAGFCTLLKDTEVKVVATALDGRALLEEVRKYRPDVVVTDIKMPVMEGAQATRIIKEEFPGTRVLALTNYDEMELVRDMMESGADGFAIKNVGKEELINAIKIVKSGAKFYCSHTAKMMYDRPAKKLPEGVSLTKRELEVLVLIARGYSNKMIAAALGNKTRTVHTLRAAVYKKIGAKTGAEVAVFAIKHRLV